MPWIFSHRSPPDTHHQLKQLTSLPPDAFQQSTFICPAQCLCNQIGRYPDAAITHVANAITNAWNE
jgi:hypothetical protein